MRCARFGDDLRVQPEFLRNVDARRCSRHADPQLEGRSQRLLVKADGGVEHALCVLGVHLQRSVMGRDDAHGLAAAEIVGDSHRQSRALLRVGR